MILQVGCDTKNQQAKQAKAFLFEDECSSFLFDMLGAKKRTDVRAIMIRFFPILEIIMSMKTVQLCCPSSFARTVVYCGSD